MDLNNQSFAGNKLDRSFGSRKDEDFIIQCFEQSSVPSRILPVLDIKNNKKLLTSFNGKDYNLVYFTLHDILSITETQNTADLLQYNCVLLGCIHHHPNDSNHHRYIDNNSTTSTSTNITTNLGEEWYISILFSSEYEDKILQFLINMNEKVDHLSFQDGRSLLTKLKQHELAVAGEAIAMASWHSSNIYDGKTGLMTTSVECGMKRVVIFDGKIQEDGGKLYPRIDPVMISCVVSPDKQKCLLGKMKKHPTNFFSCLSGFVEPCESVQEAVRREVWEEAGLLVGEVEIVSSQPWPIGRGGGCELMIGCYSYALTDDITIQDEEVETVRWFTLEEVKSMIDESLTRKELRPSAYAYIPGPYAIAHHLIKKFIDHTEKYLKDMKTKVTESIPSEIQPISKDSIDLFPSSLTLSTAGYTVGLISIGLLFGIIVSSRRYGKV